MIPATEPNLSDEWLVDLTQALRNLSAHPLPAHGMDAEHVNDGIRAFFGLDVDVRSVPWTTAHCDLHWGNLTAPRLAVLDWETWGRAPAGYDAATLLCTALPYADVSKRLQHTLAEFLDTPSGRVATLAAATRLLRFADSGELTALALPVRRHAMKIIETL